MRYPASTGGRAIFGAGIGAGFVALLIAPLMSRLLRFFPPVVTGTIILIIGVTLMRVGVGWAMGGPESTAQTVDTVKLAAMVDAARASAAQAAAALPPGIVALSIGFGLIPLVAPRWAQQMAHSLHPLLESGILLTAVAAVALNLFFNGTRDVPAESHTDAGATNNHTIVQGSKA